MNNMFSCIFFGYQIRKEKSIENGLVCFSPQILCILYMKKDVDETIRSRKKLNLIIGVENYKLLHNVLNIIEGILRVS